MNLTHGLHGMEKTSRAWKSITAFWWWMQYNQLLPAPITWLPAVIIPLSWGFKGTLVTRSSYWIYLPAIKRTQRVSGWEASPWGCLHPSLLCQLTPSSPTRLDSVKWVKKMASWNKIKVKLFTPNRINWKELHVDVKAIKTCHPRNQTDSFLRCLWKHFSPPLTHITSVNVVKALWKGCYWVCSFPRKEPAAPHSQSKNWPRNATS